jgi:hypothetical protein
VAEFHQETRKAFKDYFVCLQTQEGMGNKRNQMISEDGKNLKVGKNVKRTMVANGTDNTTSRYFRQLIRNILWLVVDFFLTSFPQPTILPNQTRGKIDSVTTNFLASINRVAGW